MGNPIEYASFKSSGRAGVRRRDWRKFRRNVFIAIVVVWIGMICLRIWYVKGTVESQIAREWLAGKRPGKAVQMTIEGPRAQMILKDPKTVQDITAGLEQRKRDVAGGMTYECTILLDGGECIRLMLLVSPLPHNNGPKWQICLSERDSDDPAEYMIADTWVQSPKLCALVELLGNEEK